MIVLNVDLFVLNPFRKAMWKNVLSSSGFNWFVVQI